MDSCQQYRHYSVEDFVNEQSFWAWALGEGKVECNFWQQFLTDNPDKAEEIEQAKRRIEELNSPQFRLMENRAQALWSKIRLSIRG